MKKEYIVYYGGLSVKRATEAMLQVAKDIQASGITDIRINLVTLRIDLPNCFIRFHTMQDIKSYKLRAKRVSAAFGFTKQTIIEQHIIIDNPTHQGTLYEYLSEIEGKEITQHVKASN